MSRRSNTIVLDCHVRREVFINLLLLGFFAATAGDHWPDADWQARHPFALHCKHLQQSMAWRFCGYKLIRRNQCRIYFRTALASVAINFWISSGIGSAAMES